ncbi:MAG: PIN domain-containing protein [Acidimicrobiaceae bacterium]|nr:PIN domain-containing protein [Acidimicrobiaceae bacterium]
MTTLVDTNVLIRHLTGDPPDLARRATAYLASRATGEPLVMPDLILAEFVYVLESVYEVPRHRVAELARSVLTSESIRTADVGLLLRAVEVYEVHRIEFSDAYLVALAETAGAGGIASFDRSIDRVPTITRIEP